MNWTKWIFYSLLLALIVLGLFFYHPIIYYLIYAFIFSYILDPFVSWFERKRFPRWLAVLTIYIIIAGIIALFTSRLVPALVQQGNNLFNILSSGEQLTGQYIITLPFIRRIYEFLQELDAQIPGLGMAPKLIEILDQANVFLAKIPKLLIDNYKKIFSTISIIFTVPLISFFLLKDKYKLRKGIVKMFSNRYFELCIIMMRKIDSTIGNFLRAILFEIIAVGILASTALTIVGVPYSILIGATAGVANIIPYFGPFLGGALAVVTVLFNGGTILSAITVILAMYIVQLIDNNIVYPVVVGGTINMHPLLVLLTLIAGGWYGGILWMLISVPLVYLTYNLIKVLYTNLKGFKII
ncbi:MAG TPA: AI-2E family transporter [Candidatus Cloacimonas acidaminovorans]|nr:AI-2E family transporter [Candidatus Cloacimonas acidaminovorans]